MAFLSIPITLRLWLTSLILPLSALGTFNAGQSMLGSPASNAVDALQELRSTLEVMQSKFFSPWLGTWPESIDWTGAVLNTHVSAVLDSLSPTFQTQLGSHLTENEVNKYFDHIVSYYFGENHFAIRNEAYDDILWVVLGWLESIQFINSHSLHYDDRSGSGWHGQQFGPAFVHRARVFYDLAEQGWDWRLCGGGMTWNPRLVPYKNAITNQLFIAASAAMYLQFPGDDNDSPFLSYAGTPTYDARFLTNAIQGYDWLKGSGMINDHGLYADGFHIKDYRTNHSKTECDDRNEMVYTYNQGVILSGLRGLWEATGNTTYLHDGHELIRNVLRATGWSEADSPSSSSTERWGGLGSRGILTEICDPWGTCSQDGQTFKGIFFHHLSVFSAARALCMTQGRYRSHEARCEAANFFDALCVLPGALAILGRGAQNTER